MFDLFTTDSKNHMGYCARFVFTCLPRLVKDHSLIAPHDWESKEKHGKSVAKTTGNLCIEYFHTKAQKLQKVLRTKAQENATEGAVELDVGDNFAARVIHCAVEEGTREIFNSIYECESSRLALDAKELRVRKKLPQTFSTTLPGSLTCLILRGKVKLGSSI